MRLGALAVFPLAAPQINNQSLQELWFMLGELIAFNLDHEIGELWCAIEN
jgi:hypothetical protein